MKYWILKTGAPEGGAYLSEIPEGGPEAWEYREGISLKERYPEGSDASIYFDPDYPEDTGLYDFMDNINGFIIANQKVRDVLAALEINNLEYLPVWLRDHQDELASEDYAVINVLGSVPVIDMEKSEVRMGHLIKDQITRIKNLVVDYPAIPEDAKIFRATTKLDEIFVRDDVKQALEAATLQDCWFYEADGWNGLNL